MIRHVVSWKLKAQDDAGKAQAFTEMAEALGALPHLIPEIKSFHIGRDLDATDGNWDVVLMVDYATVAGLATYQAHPEHVKAGAIVRERVTERATVDFEF
jgi:hypothetical protein